MGYYTSYTIQNLDIMPQEVIDAMYKDENIARILDDGYAKWYEHDQDMKSLSRRFPNIVFILDGEGEAGASDIWRKYYKNGMVQECHLQIVFEPFDESKLKEIE